MQIKNAEEIVLRVKAGYNALSVASLLAVSLVATLSKATVVIFVVLNLVVRIWTYEPVKNTLIVRLFIRSIRFTAVILSIFMMVMVRATHGTPPRIKVQNRTVLIITHIIKLCKVKTKNGEG